MTIDTWNEDIAAEMINHNFDKIQMDIFYFFFNNNFVVDKVYVLK